MDEIVPSYCRSCNQSTDHSVRASHHLNNIKYLDDHPDENIDAYAHHYFILECRGCHTISFRQVENKLVFKGRNDEARQYEPAYSDELYPSVKNLEVNPKQIHEVPPELEKIYNEIVSAFNSSLIFLSTCGLRAIVEAISNNRGITRGRLVDKIDALSRDRILSEQTAQLLHRLRFLGNDALHNHYTPNKDEVKKAIETIEHVMKEIYEIPATRIAMDRLITNRVSNL